MCCFRYYVSGCGSVGKCFIGGIVDRIVCLIWKCVVSSCISLVCCVS